jgi:predicted dehydrogenase
VGAGAGMSTHNPASPIVRVGMLGSSWWADAMYLPALAEHPVGHITAIAGRNAAELAQRWGIPHVFGKHEELLASGLVDAVIIATRNDQHCPLTLAALDRGLHVLCEKPLGLTYAEAVQMAARATAQRAICMTPFTYHYMPIYRYLKTLIAGGAPEAIGSGYIGRPYHLNFRYFTGFGRAGGYNWRFDQNISGSGALGDIASHFLFLAWWYYGEITAICAELGRLVERAPLNPAGKPYPQADDNAMLLLQFASGAQGMIHATTVAGEETPFGQLHELDFHGDGGTLHARMDWDREQSIRGARQGEGAPKLLEIPPQIWQNARRDTVHNTYRDVFRTQETMARAWVTAIAQGQLIRPDFADGATIQRIMAAAQRSHSERRWVDVADI